MGSGLLPREFDAYINVHPDNYTNLLDGLHNNLPSAQYTIVCYLLGGYRRSHV